MEETKNISGEIWLYGNPIFSLSYSIPGHPPKDPNLGIFTDVTGYRPDFRDYLDGANPSRDYLEESNDNKKYKAILSFAKRTDYKGDDIWVLTKITTPHDKMVYVYVRA
jgi:hypothetical protein